MTERHVCLCHAVSIKPESLSLSVSLTISASPRKNPECGGKCSATNVSKVSAVLLAMSAESGEYVFVNKNTVSTYLMCHTENGPLSQSCEKVLRLKRHSSAFPK